MSIRHRLGVYRREAGSSEGLSILGWVAMWRPVEIFLYDWWPEIGKRRLFDRLASMPIDTVMSDDIPDGSQRTRLQAVSSGSRNIVPLS
jgi:hypothetical protein